MSNSYGLQGRCPITMPFDGLPLRCLRPAAHDGDHEWQIPRIVTRGDENQTPEDVRANIDFGGTATADEREPGCLGSRPGSVPVTYGAQEGICVAISHLDHGRVDLARAELLACLPRQIQIEYRCR